jgi:hypothetical protein
MDLPQVDVPELVFDFPGHLLWIIHHRKGRESDHFIAAVIDGFITNGGVYTQINHCSFLFYYLPIADDKCE